MGVFSLVVGLAFATPKVQEEEEGTYIENIGPEDSSYAETDLLDFDEDVTENEGSSKTNIIIIVAIIVVGGVIVAVSLRKKSKSN